MKGRQRIRVLVDRSYRNRTGVPEIFMGFNVVIDVREPQRGLVGRPFMENMTDSRE